MKRIIPAIVSLLVVSTILVCTSCKNRKEETILLDNSQPLALAPDVTWAVVSNPYAAYKKEVGWDSESVGHCRKGDILQVLGRSQTKKNEVWYYFEEGWLPGECLLIYSNRYKAQKMSEELSSK